MSDLFRTAVQKIVKDMMLKKYPHTLYPSCMYAKVEEVKKDGDILVVALKILDKIMRKDERFPEIPNVKTKLDIKKGDVVAVMMLYGEGIPYIVGRCE